MIKITDIYRPKADRQLLRTLLDAVWQRKSDAIGNEIAGAKDRIAQHLESLYPAEDMVLLAKYGCTSECKAVSILIYNNTDQRWNENAYVELGRMVLVPLHRTSLYCGGPRWSREPNRGVNTEYRQELIDKGEWEQVCADQEKQERERVPEELEPLFDRLSEARQQYQAEYHIVTDWPAERKEATGKYPTWAEIAEQFPVTGAEIKNHFEAQAAQTAA